jgi:hypothetical protein
VVPALMINRVAARRTDLEPTRGLNRGAREARGKRGEVRRHAQEIIGIEGLHLGDQGMNVLKCAPTALA